MSQNCANCRWWEEAGSWVDPGDPEEAGRHGDCHFPRDRLPRFLTDVGSMAFAGAASPRADWTDCPTWESSQ